MFGKRLSDYLRFQAVILGVIAVVGLARLGLSLAGLPDRTVTWLSMSVVAWAGAVYYGVTVHTTGFGSYKQLLPLVFLQMALLNAIAVLGIVLSIAGLRNIYGTPEYSGPFFAQNQWGHIVGHLTLGMIVPTLVLWGVASLVMLITKKFARRPAVA
jgi:hypothetical protein